MSMPPDSGGIDMSGASSTPLVAIVMSGRGALPYLALHGEPLLAHVLRTAHAVSGGDPVTIVVDGERPNLRAVGEEPQRIARAAGGPTQLVVAGDYWTRAHERPVAILDPLCPLVPASFVAQVLERSQAEPETALVAYRPVTDTVKSVVGGSIRGTIDRQRLAVVSSPVVLPRAVLGEQPPTDVSELVAWLRRRATVELVRAPSAARRVGDEAALQVLECVDEINRRSR
jgi:2-C-methyl-D-erythritol 4-phosphate cytidylyltransferase